MLSEQFCTLNFIYYIFYNYFYFTVFNYEEVSFSSSSLDMSISDPLFLNNSNAASAPLLQNQQHKPNQKSTSTTCKYMLLFLIICVGYDKIIM